MCFCDLSTVVHKRDSAKKDVKHKSEHGVKEIFALYRSGYVHFAANAL